MDAFRRALTGDPESDVEPLQIMPKPNTSMKRVRARLHRVAPKKTKGLERQMVARCRAANTQVEIVSWPMPDLEAMRIRVKGVPAFCSPIFFRDTGRCRWRTRLKIRLRMDYFPSCTHPPAFQR